jgi:mannosyltransferase
VSTTVPRPPSRGAPAGAAPSAGEPGRRVRLLDLAVVGGPTLLGLALCLYQLTSRSLWLDEAATVAIVSQHGAAFGAAVAHDGGNMLAFYGLLHVLIGLFGTGPLVLRLPAAVAAALTVAAVGALGLRLADRRVALVAGLLTAVSLSLIYWGQDARGYAPMVALVAASFLALVALLDARRPAAAWIAYVVLTTAAVYMGLEAALIVPAQLVALVWFRRRWAAVVSAMVASAVCCIPLAVLAAERGSGQLFWVPSPTLRVLGQVAQTLASSGLQPAFYTSTSAALAILTWVLLAAGLFATWRIARSGEHRAVWPPALMFSWLLVPAVLALLESAVGHSIFQARYLLVSLPAVSLLLGWTLTARRVPRLLSLTLLAAILALRALQVAPAYGVSSENWRAATHYVAAHTRPSDCIAFYPLDNRQPFQYYLRDRSRAPRPILPTLPFGRVRPFVEDYRSLSPGQLAALPRRCGRVWLVASHEGKSGGPPVSRANYTRFVGLVRGLAREYPRSSSRDFGQAGIVTLTLYAR